MLPFDVPKSPGGFAAGLAAAGMAALRALRYVQEMRVRRAERHAAEAQAGQDEAEPPAPEAAASEAAARSWSMTTDELRGLITQLRDRVERLEERIGEVRDDHQREIEAHGKTRAALSALAHAYDELAEQMRALQSMPAQTAGEHLHALTIPRRPDLPDEPGHGTGGGQ